jgi:hypothetical protein
MINKPVMKKYFIQFLLTLSGVFLLAIPATAQDTETTEPEPLQTRMALEYLCGPGDSVNLKAVLSVKRDGKLLALENATVEFFCAGESDVPLKPGKTTQEGHAVITVPMAGLTMDSDGKLSFRARFNATGEYPEAEESVTAKPAWINLAFTLEDTVKTLTVTALQKDGKGNKIPLSGETVIIYIPRLFSLLKIGEISLDEQGTGTMEFPANLVGDATGNLAVVARIEEHDDFGFVQGKGEIDWGIPKHYFAAEKPSRELWTPIAPVWMIITLLIMLLGVWAHYAYAVYELVMIKRIGKENETGR